MEKTYTLYAVAQKVWGADHPRYSHFESIKERDAFVKGTDYSEIAGTVKLNEAQYKQFKKSGDWDRYAE